MKIIAHLLHILRERALCRRLDPLDQLHLTKSLPQRISKSSVDLLFQLSVLSPRAQMLQQVNAFHQIIHFTPKHALHHTTPLQFLTCAKYMIRNIITQIAPLNRKICETEQKAASAPSANDAKGVAALAPALKIAPTRAR